MRAALIRPCAVAVSSPAVMEVADALSFDEGNVEDHFDLTDLTPLQELYHLLVRDATEPLCTDPLGEAAEDGSVIAPLPISDKAEPPEPGIDVQQPGHLP